MANGKQAVMAKKMTKKAEAIGEEGCGDYYYIEVRARSEFKYFRFHDVGDPGHIMRLEGLRDDGTKDDQAWLISKRDAHMEEHFLKADTKHAQEVLDIYGPAHHVEGDVFIRKLRKEAK